ncbi:MAG: dTDP-glucose 4,6-dehydratase [bacterium]
MRSLMVTGGAGFIGCNFVRFALKQSGLERLCIVDKLTYAGSLLNLEGALDDPRLRFVHADISDAPAMHALVKEQAPEALVNFAAETHVDRSIDGPAAFLEANLMGVFALLEALRLQAKAGFPGGRPACRFLQVSTDEVYGSLPPEGAFREDTPYAPNSPYSASKAAADHLVRAYVHTYGLDAVVTNCSNNYGPNQFPEKLLPLMILNALEGKPLPVYGDGGQVRDWLHVEDHCAGIWLALVKGRKGEHYNIGGGGERQNLDMVRAICAELERVKPAAQNAALRAKGIHAYADLIAFVQDRPGHDRRYAIDSSKIRRELGWAPSYTVELGLAATLNWYVEHLDWCAKVQEGKYKRERLGKA